MTARYNNGIAFLLVPAILSACGGGSDSTAPPPPTTGTIQINVVTTGVDLDANDFLLTVDDGASRVLPANGTSSIASLLPGTHKLGIGGLAINCDVTATPVFVDVTVGMTTAVDVRATCTPYLRNVIVFASEQFGFGEVMVMRPDGSRRERLTTDQAVYVYPAASPDGQSIAVASQLGGSWGIYLLDRFGKGRTKLVGNSSFDGAPAWSPDGTKLAFRSELPGPYGDYGRIFVVNRDGTGLRQVTPEVAATDYVYDDGPSWSPDGTRLVFTRGPDLFLINADGTGLTATGVQGSYPSWSPDGTQIAYGSVTGLDGTFVMDLSFTPRRVTAPGMADRLPRWSPDGIELVFQRADEPLVTHIYKARVDGGSLIKLSTVTQNDVTPNWSRNF
jgi:dipeptidyl aminopeptidase/acylaminoacyl peptidase